MPSMMATMELTAKNFDEPDELVELPGLIEEIVEVGGFVVGREVVSPGWRWSADTKPIVGGDCATPITWVSRCRGVGASS